MFQIYISTIQVSSLMLMWRKLKIRIKYVKMERALGEKSNRVP
jgi:hypothetical protein